MSEHKKRSFKSKTVYVNQSSMNAREWGEFMARLMREAVAQGVEDLEISFHFKPKGLRWEDHR